MVRNTLQYSTSLFNNEPSDPNAESTKTEKPCLKGRGHAHPAPSSLLLTGVGCEGWSLSCHLWPWGGSHMSRAVKQQNRSNLDPWWSWNCCYQLCMAHCQILLPKSESSSIHLSLCCFGFSVTHSLIWYLSPSCSFSILVSFSKPLPTQPLLLVSPPLVPVHCSQVSAPDLPE